MQKRSVIEWFGIMETVFSTPETFYRGLVHDSARVLPV